MVLDEPEDGDALDHLGRGTLSEDDPQFVLKQQDVGRFYSNEAAGFSQK